MTAKPTELEFTFDDGKTVVARIVEIDPTILEIPPESGNRIPLSKIEPFLRNSKVISQASARIAKRTAEKP